ncbi:MAG TPA: hypothetical protein VH442_03680 [Micromonosporaceae bacterium]
MRSVGPLVVLAAGVLLSGCAGGASPGAVASASTTPTSDHTASVASSPPTCAVVPAAMVNATLGADVGPPASKVGTAVTRCVYSGRRAGHVTVQFQTGEDAVRFAAGRDEYESSGAPTADVGGFADEAYSSKVRSGGRTVNTLVARDGPVEILVRSRASVVAEEALEHALFMALHLSGR